MCGRFTLRVPVSVLISEFDLGVAADELPLFEAKYNIPPTTEIPVIREIDNRRTLSLMRWGLLPPWTKDPKKAPLLNNARIIGCSFS
jgi:putative SOS response-associated peptidase YedK